MAHGEFAGQVAIVTGGSSGIGRAIVDELVAGGARVAIFARDPEKIDQAVAEVKAAGGTAMGLSVDIREAQQVEDAVHQVEAAYGGVDILVNNAAGNFVVPAEKLSVNGWNAVINIVLNGTFYMSRAVGLGMIERGKGGRILNVLATYAWHGGPGVVHSAAAKGGVLAMTRTLAVEWARYGILINGIAPGPVERTGGAGKLWADPNVAQAVLRGIPVGRLATPEEVARVCRFMVGPDASYMNGEVLTLDGGAWLGKPPFAQ